MTIGSTPMLIELRVANLGVIDDLGLLLGPGLTAITGETGAGKTLLVEAIELLVGGRADGAMVRGGADEARVEGRFQTADGEVITTRVVPADGRSRAYVDGHMAPIGMLAERGAELVDLHGQHAHQSLLSPAVQRAALDRFAGKPALDARASYRAARRRIAELIEERASIGGDARSRARELDLLRFEASEIDAAHIEEVAAEGLDEDARLGAEEELLSDAVAHREAATSAHATVHDAGLDAVGAAVAALGGRGPFAAIEGRLRSVQAELADVSAELRAAAETVVDDPQRLEAVRLRRQLLRGLCRKYGETLADVVAYRAEIGIRLGALEGYEEKAAAIDHAVEAAEAEAAAAAAALTAARNAAAPALGKAITGHLRELALGGARFEVEMAAAESGADGADAVTFLLAANAGEAALPLAKVASGGELARTMLAARVVLSEAPPTLVFDEVDAGIGGEAGLAVGRKLAAIAREHQVLCVTHLPQVAAFAHQHVVVEKRRTKGRTVAEARTVEDDERVAELSRMLAGVGESATAREHARELLDRARAERDT